MITTCSLKTGPGQGWFELGVDHRLKISFGHDEYFLCIVILHKYNSELALSYIQTDKNIVSRDFLNVSKS